MPNTRPSSTHWQRTFWRGCLALLLVGGFALKGQAVPGAGEPAQQVSAAESAHWWATGVQELALTGQRLTADADTGGELPPGLVSVFSLVIVAAMLLSGWRSRFDFTPNLRSIRTRPAAPRAPPR